MLDQLSLGTLTISDKVSRVEKHGKMLEEVETSRTLTSARASEIQGRLNFAVSFYMGNAARAKTQGTRHVRAMSPYPDFHCGAYEMVRPLLVLM